MNLEGKQDTIKFGIRDSYTIGYSLHIDCISLIEIRVVYPPTCAKPHSSRNSLYASPVYTLPKIS